MEEIALLWFRRDLSLDDNAALCAAIRSGKKVLPVWIWSPEEDEPWKAGAASRVWLHYSLIELQRELKKRASDLQICSGNVLRCITELRKEFDVTAVYANKVYEPSWIERDSRLKAELQKQGIEYNLYPGALLFAPSAIRTAQDKPFQVFTPFWRACLATETHLSEPLEEPAHIPSPEFKAKKISIEDLNLLPKIRWEHGIIESWKPGSKSAKSILKQFSSELIDDYSVARDYPSEHGTSKLSPYLHFGEISVRRIWQTVMNNIRERPATPTLVTGKKKILSSAEIYLKELGWREFAYHVLCNFPHTDRAPLRAEFANFPWNDSDKCLEAWKEGRTGYPIVDAGMRELWHTGWMHNRVRMIVASFLVKDLLVSWQEGANWFWDTLVDADLANNSLGWQWSAGCGADAAPYFRIFNPTTQSEKFDPEGKYIRKWLPELAPLPDNLIHAPWAVPAEVLKKCKIMPGKDYPNPIVDHAIARRRALDTFSTIRKGKKNLSELPG